KSLLMDRSVRVAIEEAAELVLQLADALDCNRNQGPRELLVGQPFAAFDRIHEMALDGVARRERGVIPALNHARAPALAEEALYRDGDGKLRIRLVRVQG